MRTTTDESTSWICVSCAKCGAVVGLPAERIDFRDDPCFGVVAVDASGWAHGDDLQCPFHPGMTYWLERLASRRDAPERVDSTEQRFDGAIDATNSGE